MDYSRNSNEKRNRQIRSKGRKSVNKIKVLIFRVFVALVLIVGFAAIGAGAGIYFGILADTPKLTDVTFSPLKYATVIYYGDTNEEVIRLSEDENREYVSIDKIPKNMKNALVAIEDERFYEHNGIDVKSMGRAIYVTLTTDRTEGASTLTQQVIKNNVAKRNKNDWKTKIQEQYLAVEYEKKLVKDLGTKEAAKDKILETYLNTIGLGHALNGVQTAAKYYFGKDVSELTLSESAVIASITQSPTALSPVNHPDANRERQVLVLGKMLQLEMITQEEYDTAINDNVYERISQNETVSTKATTVYSYYTDEVIKHVASDLVEQKGLSEDQAYDMIYNGGLQIRIPQDKSMQKIMDDAFLDDSLFPPADYKIQVQYSIRIKNTITDKIEDRYKSGYVKTNDQVEGLVENIRNELLKENEEIIAENYDLVPQPQAAMIIVDSFTGQVKAITGGRGEKAYNLSFDRATDAKRQPGSVMKILASYAPAIDMGLITPATVIDDVPLTIGNKEFANWNKRYKGLTTVREGIWDSMNILAVKNLMNTGIDNSFDYLHNFGITTIIDQDKVPALALGGLTKGVTQIEVAGAFAAIANGGTYHKPSFYTKVLDHDNNVLLENNDEAHRVLKETSAFLLTDMMKDVITKGTGGQVKFTKINMPVAGKTGTTSDSKDLCFAGFTPYYTASIWLGADDPVPLIDQNSSYHNRLWRNIMQDIHADLPIKDFIKPDGIVTASVCQESGQLAVAGKCDNDPRGSRIITEYFASDNVPTTYCDVHQAIQVDSSTNMIAGPYCPEEFIVTKFGIVRPIPYTGSEHVEDEAYVVGGGKVCDVHTEHGFVLPDGSVDVNSPFYVAPTISEEPYSDFTIITPAPIIDEGDSYNNNNNDNINNSNNYNNNNNSNNSNNTPTKTATPQISEEPFVVPDFQEDSNSLDNYGN